MSRVKFPITESEYKEIAKLPKQDEKRDELMYKHIPIEYKCGYGVYGVWLTERDGNFYVEAEVGDSCD